GCDSSSLQIHGDDPVFCDLGPSALTTDGTTGRWVDKFGNDMEIPICVLRRDWCPGIELMGLRSEVKALTNSYEFASIATLRCHLGYEMVGGNDTLTCLNGEAGLTGVWDSMPLRCELAPNFCPSPDSSNAYQVQGAIDYTLGIVATFKCHRGFTYLSGDLTATCEVSDSSYGGLWKAGPGAAQPVVCVPEQAYCPVPNIFRGFVASVTSAGEPGSVAELRCHDGFHDPRTKMTQRTTLCLDKPGAGETAGNFSIGLSFTSRDLQRAEELVIDVLEVLEEHDAAEYRFEDFHWDAKLRFQGRWVFELGSALRDLQHDMSVREVLQMFPHFDGISDKYLEQFTSDHLRILLRLLKAKAEQLQDLTAETAREQFGAYDRLKISFQNGKALPPDGWLADSGKQFGDRRNGLFYGWKCGVSESEINSGAANRSRSLYSSLENTLVATDPLSRCEDQEWYIHLPTGSYLVEVTVQDTQHLSTSSGCRLQGTNLGFPSTVGPPGTAVMRSMTVHVTGNLTISADEDSGCSTLNRVTIQDITALGAGNELPVLQCDRIAGWCPVPEARDKSHIVSMAAMSPRYLGSQVQFACDDRHVYDHGLTTLMCGSTAGGSSGRWVATTGGQSSLQISCSLNRTWCPALPVLTGAAVTSLAPPHQGVGSEVMLQCRRGFRRQAGNPYARCTEGTTTGVWCSGTGPDDCTTPAIWLHCEAIPDYCSPMNGGESLIANVSAGMEGEDEFPSHVTRVVSEVIPVPAGAYGGIVELQCPPHHRQVIGDSRVVCGHGPLGSGAWQRARENSTIVSDSSVDDSTIQLVDEAIAQPLVCELDHMYGARRQYYTTFSGLYGGNRSGLDVVPNIDETESQYDSYHFETWLSPNISDSYIFSIEVIGSFTFSLDGRVLLSGRSKGVEAQRFRPPAQELLINEYYKLSLQFLSDPDLSDRSDPAQREVTRHIRLLWASTSQPTPVIVPPTVLYHSFEQLYSFPRVVSTLNDMYPCDAENPVIRRLSINDTGVLFDGTKGRKYNQKLHCTIVISTEMDAVFNVFVNYFDVQETPGCIADRVDISQGLGGGQIELVGARCGVYAKGDVLASFQGRALQIDFVTDNDIENEGFNISYEIRPWLSDKLAVTTGAR
ncbi:unnamed protein product, partial [Polarella glacialis]